MKKFNVECHECYVVYDIEIIDDDGDDIEDIICCPICGNVNPIAKIAEEE